MITLFIPFYGNKTEFIVKTLDNIHSLDLISKVIIIDDNGHNKSQFIWNQIIEKFSKVEIFYNEFNSGPSFSRNRALELVKSPYILFCDADVIVNNAGFREIEKFILEKKINCLQGIYSVENHLKNSVSRYKHYSQMVNILKINEGETSLVGTSLFLIKTDIFKATEGFIKLDSNRASVEDRLLGIQLKKLGIQNYLLKSFNSEHCHEFNLISLINTTFYRAMDEIRYKAALEDNINFTAQSKIISVMFLAIATILILLFNFKASLFFILGSILLDLIILKISFNVFELKWILYSFATNYSIGLGGFCGLMNNIYKKYSIRVLDN